MGTYENLKNAIAEVIKTNGNQEITGAILQNTLQTIVSTIGENATFAGIATPTTNPGTPDQNVFYIAATPGTYANFGGVTITDEVVIFINKNGSWAKSDTGIATGAKVSELEQKFGFGFNATEVGVMPNIDTTNKVLDLGGDPVLYMGNKYYAFKELFPDNAEYYRAIPIYEEGQDSGAIKLVFNTETNRIYPKWARGAITSSEVVIGGFRLEYATHNFISANLPFDYTIDGEKPWSSDVDALSEATGTISMVGVGNNQVTKYLDWQAGKSYLFIPRNPAWDITGVTDILYAKLILGIEDEDGSFTDFVRVPVTGSVSDSYLITMPSDYDPNTQKVKLVIRATSGERVIFNSEYGGIIKSLQADSEELKAKDGFGFTATGGKIPNIDTTNKVLDLGGDPVLYVGGEYYAFKELYPDNPEYYRAILIYQENQDSGAIKLIFNVSTKRIYARYAKAEMSDSEVVIGGFRLEYATHNFVSANLPFDYTIDGEKPWEKEIENINERKVAYTGERPALPRWYNHTILTQLSKTGTYDRSVASQGMDIKDGFIFQGNNPNASAEENYNNIYVIDIENNSLVGGVEFKKASHLNTINCGEKYDEGDTYPLLYISECYYNHACDVVRLSDELSSYEIVQQITYSGQYFSGWSAYDWAIDTDNSYIYAYGTDNGFTQILQFALPSPTEGNVVLGDDDIITTIDFTGAYIYQGAKIINNQMYIPFGFGTEQYPGFIKVVDIARKAVITHIPLAGFGEPEAVALYQNKLVFVNASSDPIYRKLTLE